MSSSTTNLSLSSIAGSAPYLVLPVVFPPNSPPKTEDLKKRLYQDPQTERGPLHVINSPKKARVLKSENEENIPIEEYQRLLGLFQEKLNASDTEVAELKKQLEKASAIAKGALAANLRLQDELEKTQKELQATQEQLKATLVRNQQLQKDVDAAYEFDFFDKPVSN